jgi:hypothetical protein
MSGEPSRHVRFGSKADMCATSTEVRFVPFADPASLKCIRHRGSIAVARCQLTQREKSLIASRWRLTAVLGDDRRGEALSGSTHKLELAFKARS